MKSLIIFISRLVQTDDLFIFSIQDAVQQIKRSSCDQLGKNINFVGESIQE